MTARLEFSSDTAQEIQRWVHNYCLEARCQFVAKDQWITIDRTGFYWTGKVGALDSDTHAYELKFDGPAPPTFCWQKPKPKPQRMMFQFPNLVRIEIDMAVDPDCEIAKEMEKEIRHARSYSMSDQRINSFAEQTRIDQEYRRRVDLKRMTDTSTFRFVEPGTFSLDEIHEAVKKAQPTGKEWQGKPTFIDHVFDIPYRNPYQEPLHGQDRAFDSMWWLSAQGRNLFDPAVFTVHKSRGEEPAPAPKPLKKRWNS